MTEIGTSAVQVAQHLRTAWPGLDYMDAALITEYAQAEGQHEIPGTGGLVLVYREGAWYTARRAPA